MRKIISNNQILAAAFLYDTPNTWFRSIPHVIASNISHKNYVKVFSQAQMPAVKWHRDYNHVFDSVPLQLVRIANETLNFQWLIVSDGDTCFNIAALTDRLKELNSSNPYLIGQPMSPSWKCCCTGASCCTISKPYVACNIHLYSKNFYAAGFSKPRIWPYGGAGYIISKSLLNSIRKADWRRCETSITRNGGDVRVAACILSLTQVGLTYLPSMLGSISFHKRYACGKRLGRIPVGETTTESFL